MARRLGPGPLLIALLAASTAVRCANECAEDSDCANDQRCTGGKCQQRLPPIPPPPPVGDGGIRDALPPDAGDAGANPDAFTPDALPVPDAGDGGIADARPDAMPTDGPITLPTTIEVVAAEFAASLSADVHADLVERAGVTYSFSERRYPDADGHDCVLTVTRKLSGTEGAIPAARVRLTKGAEMRELLPQIPNPARFEPMTTWVNGFITESPIVVSLVGTGASGSVNDQAFAALNGPPALIQGLPASGQPISLAGGLMLTWSGALGWDPVVEIFDLARTVVLRCGPLTNDGQYFVPINATDTWRQEAPTGARFLELRVDAVQSVSATLSGIPATIPTTVRLSRGVRYSVQ